MFNLIIKSSILFAYLCVIKSQHVKHGDFLQDIIAIKSKLKLGSTATLFTKEILMEGLEPGNLMKDFLQASPENDGSYTGPYEVSPLCINHTNMYMEGITRRDTWALQMLDATGKPGSGLLDFQIVWLGNYEECISVYAWVFENPVNKTGPSHPFDGKYCLAYFPLGQASQASLLQPGGVTVQIGLCLPDSCNNMDAGLLAYALYRRVFVPGNATNTTIPYAYAMCQDEHIELSSKAIAVIVICAIFLFVVLVATVYDIVIQNEFLRSEPKQKISPGDQDYGTFKSWEAANGAAANGHVKNIHVANAYDDDTPLTKSSKEKEKEMQPGTLDRALLSFSAYTNAQKIFNTNQPLGTLTSVNGIRFISMTWVILGHTYAFGLGVADNVATFLPKVLKRFTFQAISNATVAVDTFFVLSGLLVAYLTLREMKKRGGAKRFNWGMFYFHRFWRLTPPYMLVMMFYIPTIRYWTTGPLWPQQTGFEKDECTDTWWKNLLYVNNIVDPKNMCMAWSWYLANDMQFYVVSPLLLIPLYYSPLWGTISCLALVLTNFITAGVISKQHKLDSNFILGDTGNDSFGLLYIKPWCRVAPYAVGLFTGYLLYLTDCKVKISKIVNLLGWAVATTFSMLVLYGLYNSDGISNLSVDVSALYNATARTAWALAVAWVIFACATGNGGPVNALLSWKAIIPLSRLTYCAYLIHPLVMFTYFYSRRTLMRWYDLQMAYTFMGNLCLAYAAAFITSLTFESPMMGLEKVVFGRGKQSQY